MNNDLRYTIMRLATRLWSYCPVDLKELVTKNRTAWLALQYGGSMETVYKVVPGQKFIRLETWSLVDELPMTNTAVDSILRNQSPVPVMLNCPECLHQHIDRGEWASIPHKSHLCDHCGHIWRPSDTYTVGIERPSTKGKKDHHLWEIKNSTEWTTTYKCRNCQKVMTKSDDDIDMNWRTRGVCE